MVQEKSKKNAIQAPIQSKKVNNSIFLMFFFNLVDSNYVVIVDEAQNDSDSNVNTIGFESP